MIGNHRTRRVHGRILGGIIAASLAAASARADFELFWFTIDGGGAQAMTGGDFELSGTVGQSDAGVAAGDALEFAGGFWPGAIDSGQCSGSERVSKTRCSERNGSNQLKVILVGGVEGNTFTVTLLDGSTKSGTCNRRGKGKAKFNNRPAGDAGAVNAEWACGAFDQKAYSCP
ncbi:MAG: hypothetical protein FLDDKLPJ_03590 [Phycisphaerae bacterium]|nr:hypothetical protein [Phycisphaerae bacterium]